MTDKIKVFTISDHPLMASGVAHTMRTIIGALLKSGKFTVYSFGGAIKHNDYSTIRTEEYGDDWLIQPVDGFGNPEMVRSFLRTQRPDVLLFQSDPRFFQWLLEISNEIRPMIPMAWYGIWDNYPYPIFNEAIWGSNDQFISISKVTHDIVSTVCPELENAYIPHSVDNKLFKPIPREDLTSFAEQYFPTLEEDRFVVYWNNRNARRKMSGSLVFWWKDFLDKIGRDKAVLIMHTNPTDMNGQNLNSIKSDLGLTDQELILDPETVTQDFLAYSYNLADVTINIADAEGFGLSTLESLSCGVPIIVNMTGGLQEQVTDGKDWFGVGIEPASRAIVGTQDIPYIYEDRVSGEDVVNALLKMWEMSDKQRKKVGELGRQHVKNNYNFEAHEQQWIDLITDLHEKHGSWPTKLYKGWELLEV
jgi:glycosyltransferase involved in cell wall biosynthesis